MKGGREGKRPQSTDLLVCFPTRAHLTLMPKRICSPSRPSDINTRNLTRHHTRKPSNASPLLWVKSKNKHNNISGNKTDDIISSEPTSPKVTCAGQIKARPKPNCKNWQSVMEEIERIHNKGKQKKRATWIEAFGLKKDVTQFLTCLRHVRFDFRCFGSFPRTNEISSDDEDVEEDDDVEEGDNNGDYGFSKWFRVLQDQESCNDADDQEREGVSESTVEDDGGPCAPAPPNALLLMRCRSAPAKSWREERKESLVVDYSKLISCDIAKETWVVGDVKDMLSRSRSYKR